MQILRNIAWWLIGFSVSATFVLVVLLGEVLQGQFSRLSQSVLITVYVAILLGFINNKSILRLGETLMHEIGHAQIAALTFSQVLFIRVERDSSGVTWRKPNRLFGRITSAAVSLAGPLATTSIFLITARFISAELTQYWVIGLAAIILLILVTTVRSIWGWITGGFILSILYLLLESIGFIDPFILNEDYQEIVKDYLIHIILGFLAFNTGSALRYSWYWRKGQNPSSDEYKFSKALFLPTGVGGRLIFLFHLPLIWLALSFLLGWSSPFAPEGFL
jgi:hypothetical protein